MAVIFSNKKTVRIIQSGVAGKNAGNVIRRAGREKGEQEQSREAQSATPTCSTRYGNRAHRAINKGDLVLAREAVGVDVMDDGRRRG